MKQCIKECYLARVPCENRNCRMHIEYEEDLNCTVIALKKHGPMTLEEIGKRHQNQHSTCQTDCRCYSLKIKKDITAGKYYLKVAYSRHIC